MSRYSMDPSKGGIKKDEGKDLWHLLPDELLEGCLKVLMVGAAKYDEFNWAKGMPYSRVYNSLRRHLNEFWKGTDCDPETGLPHVNHLLCNALFLAYIAKRYPKLDDRPKLSESTPQPAVPLDEPRAKMAEAILTNQGRIQDLYASERSAPEILQELPQAPGMKGWNPPAPGSVLFESPAPSAPSASEPSSGPLQLSDLDIDEPLGEGCQYDSSQYKRRVLQRRRNPLRGSVPID